MRTVILIPWRPTPDREPLWNHVRSRLSRFGFPIVTADADSDIFSIGRAFNAAATEAGAWDRAIFSEADVFVADSQIRAALELGEPHVWCYDSHIRLSEEETPLVLDDWPLPVREPEPAQSYMGSNGVRVITRVLWDQVDGYDPAFIGWGAEDNDFIARVRKITEPVRVPGIMYELFHERDPRYYAARSANRALLKQKHG